MNYTTGTNGESWTLDHKRHHGGIYEGGICSQTVERNGDKWTLETELDERGDYKVEQVRLNEAEARKLLALWEGRAK